MSTTNGGLEYVAEHIISIREMLFRICTYMQRPDLVDDVFSECILEVANRVYDKYDCSIGTRDGFMFAQFQLYARRWFQSLRTRQSRFVAMDDDAERARVALHDAGISALLTREQVILYMAKLTAHEERIVRMHIGYDQSFDEIAERLGGGVSTIRVTFNAAMERLQDLANHGRSATE
jgi:RNA polymerase sigma factor (sigma-70 family)